MNSYIAYIDTLNHCLHVDSVAVLQWPDIVVVGCTLSLTCPVPGAAMGKKIIMLLCRCCSQQNQKDQKLNMNISGSSRSSRVSSVSRGRSRSPIRRSVPPQRGVTPPPPPALLPSGLPMPPPVPSGVPSRRIVGGDDAIVEYVPSPMQPPPMPPPRHPPPPAVPGPRMRSSWSSHELPPPPLPGAVLPSPLVTGQACVLVPRRDSDAHLAGKKIEKKHKKKKNKSKKKVSKMAPPPGQKVVCVKKMPKTDRATSSMAPPPGQKVVLVKKMPKQKAAGASGSRAITFRGKWIPRGSVGLRVKKAMMAIPVTPVKTRPKTPVTPPKSPAPSVCSNCGNPLESLDASDIDNAGFKVINTEEDLELEAADYTRSPTRSPPGPSAEYTRSPTRSPPGPSEAASSYKRPRFH